jgi:hypothetical protein
LSYSIQIFERVADGVKVFQEYIRINNLVILLNKK